MDIINHTVYQNEIIIDETDDFFLIEVDAPYSKERIIVAIDPNHKLDYPKYQPSSNQLVFSFPSRFPEHIRNRWVRIMKNYNAISN